MHGSYHWYFERFIATNTMVLLTAMIVLPETYTWVDLGLTAILPIHAHLGLSCIITDYLPKRKFPYIYRASMSLLTLGSLLTAYGLYQFNTNDIGISAFIRKIWTVHRKEITE